MRFWIAAASLVLTSPASPQAPVAASLEQQLAWNMARGDELYAYDQSAWHVTDAAFVTLPAESKSLIRGYVSTPVKGGIRTIFFGEDNSNYYTIYSATWTGSTITDSKAFEPRERVPVSEVELRLIRARKVVFESGLELSMCSSAAPNAIVIAGASEDDPVSVYILTPPTKPNVYPVGGHHRMDVKGGKIVGQRTFSNACLDMERPRQDVVGLGVTHLLDPIPTEIHAFVAHATGLPLFVGVEQGDVYGVEVRNGVAKASRLQLEGRPKP